MMKDNSYAAIMARKNEIIRNSVGMDYESFEKPGIGFDYEAMMAATGYTLPELPARSGSVQRRQYAAHRAAQSHRTRKEVRSRRQGRKDFHQGRSNQPQRQL